MQTALAHFTAWRCKRDRLLSWIHSAVTAIVLTLTITTQAHAYPNQPIRMVTPWPPGGSTDVIARIVAESLTTTLGQAVIVENISGASGAIGAQSVINSQADGYTILLANMTEVVLNPLLSDLNYDPDTQLSPIGHIGSVPSILIGRKSLSAANVQELLTELSGQDASIGITGTATPQHIATELFKRETSLEAEIIPYRGGSPVLVDVIGGHIDLGVVTLTTALSQAKSGAVKAYGITTLQRSSAAPEFPALAETPGLENFNVGSWFGVYAPAATDQAILSRLEVALLEVLEQPETRTKLEQQGVTLEPGGAEFLRERSQQQKEMLREIIDAASIKAQLE